MEPDRPRASLPGRCVSDPVLPLQSLAMLKDGFRTDRGSHSDLWSSSSSLESSGFLLPKQYLDVSSQTDISGSVSSSFRHCGPPEGQPPGGCWDGRPPSHFSPGSGLGALWSSVLLQSPWPSMTGGGGVKLAPTPRPPCHLATCCV